MAPDTRGLASGFDQGFGLMNQYQFQQSQQERADKRLNMEEQGFGLKMDMEQLKLVASVAKSFNRSVA